MESANREEDDVPEASEDNISEVDPALSPIETNEACSYSVAGFHYDILQARWEGTKRIPAFGLSAMEDTFLRIQVTQQKQSKLDECFQKHN